MAPRLFFSHTLDALVEPLLDLLQTTSSQPLQAHTIVVPNAQLKQWLLLEIAKRKGVAMGLRVVEIEQLYPASVSSLEMFCLIYSELSACTDPELVLYLDGKKKRLLDLTEQLTSLFFTYSQFGQHLFEGAPQGWQQTILQRIHASRSIAVRVAEGCVEPVICFGVDLLAPVYWEKLFRSSSLSVFLFSPCIEFWADVCTDWERKRLNRYWKKREAPEARRAALDAFLRQGPRILANWGKLGRETLKILDSIDWEVEECYPDLQPDSLLKRFKLDLLTFQEPQKGPLDDSIQVFLTGSSRLHEVQCLRDEICRLAIPYHEISVLAPDIEPYVSLIEFVFADKIPYRISSHTSCSRFAQALLRLLRLGHGRWDAEEVLALFEEPLFYQKRGWDSALLEQFREWISAVEIKWGFDAAHRRSVLQSTLNKAVEEDQGSWERGLERLLDAIVYLRPMEVNADQLEELIAAIYTIKELPLQGEKTLAGWADCLQAAADDLFVIDAEDQTLAQLFFDLKSMQVEGEFPVEVIEHCLLRPRSDPIHPNHLHAIHVTSIENGALLPARARFLIGMDEEQFPRPNFPSSLDLLKNPMADRDRYFLLQALFSTQEFLRISYGHLSKEEGKPVFPSLAVQELLSASGVEPVLYRPPPLPVQQIEFPWPSRCQAPLCEGVIPISELRQLARHPWKFFLQKAHGIYLNEELEESFALQKGLLLSGYQDRLPTGRLGGALRAEVEAQKQVYQERLAEWGVEMFSLILRESCTEPGWEGGNYIAPALEVAGCRLVGEIKQASMKGLICTQEDSIKGLLKVWPEALIVGLVLGVAEVRMLKSGKVKIVANLEPSLAGWIRYYFEALQAPSPLLPDWADSCLRKGPLDLEKDIAKQIDGDDPVVNWVLARSQMPTAEAILHNWGPMFQEVLASLIQLYPLRGKNYAAL